MLKKIKEGYIDSFDGIRALAVIIIVIFHYYPSGFELLQGGFIGVDIFFVLSGYLISSILLEQWQKNETINLRRFWLMRFRRLLPAVIFLVSILVFLASIFPYWQELKTIPGTRYLPDFSGELISLKNQLFPAVAYFINWHFIFSGKSYFELMDRPSLFSHLWSLAIEAQFYLLWPIVLLILFRICGLRKNLIALFFLALTCISSFLLYFLGQAPPFDARAYFGTDSRAYALMLGAIISLYFRPKMSEARSYVKSFVVDCLGFFGLTMIILLAIILDGQDIFIFRGGLFLASLATAIIMIICLNPNSLIVRGLLSNRIFGWIGERSYGIYLWHWPIFVLTEPQYNYLIDGWQLFILRFLLLLFIVEFSYQVVENPIRSGALEMFWDDLKKAKGVRQMQLLTKFCLIVLLIVTIGGFSLVSVAQAKDSDLQVAVVNPIEVNEIAEEIVVNAVEVKDNIADLKDQVLSVSEGESVDSTILLSQKEETIIPPVVEVKTIDDAIMSFGDSVMLGAKDALIKEIDKIKVDAVVSRQFTEIEKIISVLKREGKLASLVFIHTGNNGTVEEKRFVSVMDSLKDCQRVVVFNVRVPRSWQNSNNEIFSRVVPKYSNAVLIDWQKESSKNKEFFYKDGIHLKAPQGVKFYASLVKQAFMEN